MEIKSDRLRLKDVEDDMSSLRNEFRTIRDVLGGVSNSNLDSMSACIRRYGKHSFNRELGNFLRRNRMNFEKDT